MATTFVLTRPDVFVSGTVAAYVKPALGVPASGAPSGSAVSSPSVVGNSVTFTGLADNTQYIAYQGSPDRYVSFRTTPASTAVSETDPVAGADLATHAALTTTAHGGLIPSTLPDAKGDLLTATAADTPARLAVGANDTVLTADSAAATGIKWAAAASGGILATIVDVKGDLIAATAADTVARLAAGANGTVLTAASGQTTGLQWSVPYAQPGFGTTLPTAADGLEYFWEVDSTNGVVWHMRYDGTLSKWLFLGGAPLFAGVDTSEATTSTSYVALTTAGPVIALPGVGGGLYVVTVGSSVQNSANTTGGIMSYDIGGTAASDVDGFQCQTGSTGGNNFVEVGTRTNRKTIATQLSLTAKYKATAGTATFKNRWMTLLPVQVNPS